MGVSYSVDGEGAPITAALLMAFNAAQADRARRSERLGELVQSGTVEAKDPQLDMADDIEALWGLMGEVVMAVHQLETGAPPAAVLDD
jgi:hypothetical protein